MKNERPTSKWVKANVGKRVFWFCKKCEYPLFGEPKTNDCPNCGARMVKDDEKGEEENGV